MEFGGKKVKIAAAVLFCLIAGFGGFSLWLGHRDRLDQLGEENVQKLSAVVESTVDVFGRLAEMAFEDTARQPEIREILSIAVKERSPWERDFYRRMIYRHLESGFDRLAYYQVHLMNFILPDGTVFLRMHAPALYGDNVLAYSRLQGVALRTRSPARGFQFGKTVGAFYYSFPLFFGSDFLGSVEYGLSLTVFAEELQRHFPGHYTLLLRRDSLRTLAPEAFPRQYTESPYGEDIFEDLQFLKGLSVEKGLDPETLAALRERLASVLRSKFRRFSEGEAACIFLRQGRKIYSVSLLPVKDAGGGLLGYLEAINEAPAAKEVWKMSLHYAALLGLLLLSVGGLLVQVVRSHSRLVEKAVFDSLTGALKKSEFAAVSRLETARARRYRLPLSVAMLDLDDFKSVNDTYGHTAGDAALKGLGQAILDSIRKADCFFRWGGDEFFLVLPNTGREGARKLGEKLIKLAGQIDVGNIRGLSISVGIAHLEEDDPDLRPVLIRADEALYRAKRKGKNCVSD